MRVKVVPVDVAVNQILALVAAVHRTHRLPSSDVSSPRNPACEANRPGTDLGCYAVATGVDPYYQTHMNTLNQRDTKLARPFIPKRKLLDYYRPFISKIVTFDTARARAVLGLTVQSSMLRSGRAPGGDDSNKACADGDGAWVDPPVSCGSLNIDPIQTISRKWGEVGGQNSPGWIGYLKCVRDTMEKGGSSRVWADYIV